MSLRDYKFPTRVIPLGGDNKLSLRALALDDMQYLLMNKSGLIDAALDLFRGGDFDPNNLSSDQVQSMGSMLIAKLPGLVGELIAIAADERDQADSAKRLPAPVQLEAVVAVYQLTFSEPGSLGKFFDLLAGLMSGTKEVMTMNETLRAGSSSSGATLAS